MGAYLVFLLSTIAHAAPIANSTSAASAPRWVPAPQGRGTVNIFLTCLATISICAWTTLHLNVDPRTSFWRKFWKKLKWILLTIFVPEYVLGVASKQWLTARYLRLSVKSEEGRLSTLGDLQPKSLDLLFANLSAEECRGLTPEIAFYAIMGGFLIKPNSIDLESDPKEWKTLSTEGFFSLLVKSLLSKANLTKLHEEVEGLSKADMLTKVLASIQASWFLIQCIARLATGLPITLIELITATHVMCSLSIFLLWQRKPQNVTNRIVIDDYVDKRAILEGIHEQAPVTETSPSLETTPSEESDSSEAELSLLRDDDVRNGEEQRDNGQESDSQTYITTNNSVYILLDYALKLHMSQEPNRFASELRTIQNSPPVSENQSWERFKKHLPVFETAKNDRDYTYVDRLRNSLLGIVCVAYGAVHLAAWNAHFPTQIEQLLWRTSSLLIIVFYPCAMFLQCFADWLFNWALMTCGVLLVFLCGVARLFLLVEAFISFRNLPLTAYETVPWANYIPHF
ncbi:hypothetical protein RUND412_008058 [Rhizina undulata]